MTPQPHSPVTDSTDDTETCFEEILIDNMLGFASTPKVSAGGALQDLEMALLSFNC